MLSKSISRHKGLTSHPPGSLRELWHISFPLMISLMSVSMMLFLDRLFLARYSIDSLNASVNAAMVVQLFQFWCITTVSIAEIFVGQFHGANDMNKVGQPVWQMIWFGIGMMAVFLPLGYFAGPYIFNHAGLADQEITYFKWLMYFGSTAIISAALSAFYIGRGKVIFVTVITVLANIVNAGLDVLLIFGLDPIIPAMGIEGAAIATGVAQTMQCLCLLGGFLRYQNRKTFGTDHWKLDKKMFTHCFKIGLPNAVAHTLEILAWVLLFHLLTIMGSDYITVIAVSQSILFLFTFLTDGVSKGATVIASNLIGSSQHSHIWKVLRSGIRFYLIVFFLLSGVLAFYPEPLINCFLSGHIDSLSTATQAILHTSCFWVWIYFLFDGVSWLLIGLLTAAGDTKFIMVVGGLSPWFIALFPSYFFIVHMGMPADMTWIMVATYSLVTCIIYYFRFRRETWKSFALNEK